VAGAGCAWVFVVVGCWSWWWCWSRAWWGWWRRTVGDDEGGVLGVVRLGVLVLGVAALACADLDRRGVSAGEPHLAGGLGRVAGCRCWGGGLDLSRALERAWGGGVGDVDRVERQRLVVDGLDVDPDLAGGGAVLRVVGEGQGDRWACSKLGRGGQPRRDGGITVVVCLADAEFDAVVVRGQVGVLDPLDKVLDADNVAEEVAWSAEFGVASGLDEGGAKLAA